jgi:hypothetical protein
MRTSIMWLLASALLATTLALAEEGGVPLDPAGDARSAVEGFIHGFKPGMDTFDMNELTLCVRENSYGLTIAKDYRIVKPYIRWLSDTLQLPDKTRQNMLHTLGALGQMDAAKVVLKYAVDTTMTPLVRYEATVAICLLGNAEAGTQVLEDLALNKAVSYNWLPASEFFDTKWKPAKLKSTADEKAMTLFFRWLAKHAKGRGLVDAVGYLLQRDEQSRDLAFQWAERALKDPQVYLPELPHTHVRSSMLDMLTWYGDERGKALAAQYEE